MRTRSVLTLGFVLALTLGSIAQQPRPQVRNTNAEFQLIGVRLYDTGTRVVSLYGSPDDIFGLTLGSGDSGGGPAGGSGGGPGSGGGGGGGGAGPAAGSASGTTVTNYPDVVGDPFNMGTSNFRQFRPGDDEGSRDGRGGGGGGSNLSPAGAPDNGQGSGGGAGGAQSSRVTLTRWVYKRQNAHYAFVFDKFNRVVQIEALGINDKRVKTRKGMGFGNTVQQLIQKYGAPDAYEVGGQHIVVRFLVKDRVAFRLSRLKANDKHRVTGVVIAAGKS